jgi:hypothetical protein
MAEQNGELNLYQKLAKIRKAVEVLQKDATGYGYRYVTDAEILSKISGLMEQYQVSLVPAIEGEPEVTPYPYTRTKSGKTEDVYEIIVQSRIVYHWINNVNPDEKLSVPWFFVGQQADAAQAFGAGLTYSYRYFLLKFFGIATVEDDPDNWRSKQRQSMAEEAKAETEKTLQELDSLVKRCIEEQPDRKKEVVALCKKYVKDANYFQIKEPALAAKLLEEFKANFLKEAE